MISFEESECLNDILVVGNYSCMDAKMAAGPNSLCTAGSGGAGV